MMTGRDTGAALLSVLILVGIMAVLAIGLFDRLRLATGLAVNAGGRAQARAAALAAEALATTRIDDLRAASPGRTTLAGGWQDRLITLPLPAGTATARLGDGGNCFNLNSLVSGSSPDALASRPIAIAQFAALLQALDVPEADARHIAAAAADWIDSDDVANPFGAEDAAYAGGPQPYRTAGTLMADASELRPVAGMTAALYARIRPWVCALPVTQMSPVNINTITAAQAPLLALLMTGTYSPDRARRIIAERPVAGWESPAAFWNTPSLLDARPPGEVRALPQVRTRWFRLDLGITSGTADLTETALIDGDITPARLVARRWGAAE